MQNSSEKTIYILDSYGLIYRAYFALLNHPLTNTKGQNISAVVIFFRNLKALISKYNPGYLAAAFDSRTPTFRHQMYSEYKATRQKTPEDLHEQVPVIEEILTAMNIPVLREDGFEADDIIATVAQKARNEGFNCRILSGDKDLLQLVNDTCYEMQPDKANGGWETNTTEEVINKWGIPPEKILDYLSLVGDTADNIPGIKGVGDKTALKLLSEYGDLDSILSHADEIKGALGNKVREGKDSAIFSRNLIKLRTDVPLAISFEDFSTKDLDFNSAGKLLKECGALAVAKSFLTETGTLFSDTERAENTEAAVSVKKNQGNYRPCTKLEELKDFIDKVLENPEKAVAFDTETDSLKTHSANLVGFSLCSKAGEAIYVPVILPGGMFSDPVIGKNDCIAQLARILDNKDITLVMHNGKFDLEVLYANGYGRMPECKIADTMIAAWILNPDAQGKTPFGLEYLSETKLGLSGIEYNDIVNVKKGETFADVPLEKAFPYGAEDADFTWQLWQIFKKQIADEKLEELFYGMEMKVLPILTRMEIQGIHLDKKALKDYAVELSGEIENQKQRIYEHAGHQFNIASTQQLQKVLFEERGLVPGKKTKSGYSTDTAVLEELSERTTDPLPGEILAFRAASKLLNTYVETLPDLADGTGRIHTSFLQTGTATGRLSSRDPNLQNIPVRDDAGRKIRSAFTAVPGTVLISADYSQIELVVLAHLSGDKNLCRAFINGTDVHKSTAALIYGTEPDKVTPEMRRFAKTVNFGVMYGMSAFRLSNELNISRTEAKNFIDQYFETYADVKRFIQETGDFARQNGYSKTIMGRKRIISGINSKNKLEMQAAERVAINTPIQGSAADIVKQAMINVQNALDRTNSKAKMLLQVHDELIFECPSDNDEIQKTISLIRTEMENAVKLSVPLKVSIESGNNWGEFH